jgi:hypothetical protein
MNAISRTFPLFHAPVRHAQVHHGRADRNNSRSVWHESGVGLAIVLTVLILTVAGIWGNPGVQTVASWPTVAQPAAFDGSDGSTTPALFPLGPLSTEAPM